ncbi:hypothetical protein TNCV_2721541 [Trichonephila clavipes]|nr:hypothetical protein TNCV_2721541 [Trichonephila clavipes]
MRTRGDQEVYPIAPLTITPGDGLAMTMTNERYQWVFTTMPPNMDAAILMCCKLNLDSSEKMTFRLSCTQVLISNRSIRGNVVGVLVSRRETSPPIFELLSENADTGDAASRNTCEGPSGSCTKIGVFEHLSDLGLANRDAATGVGGVDPTLLRDSSPEPRTSRSQKWNSWSKTKV